MDIRKTTQIYWLEIFKKVWDSLTYEKGKRSANIGGHTSAALGCGESTPRIPCKTMPLTEETKNDNRLKLTRSKRDSIKVGSGLVARTAKALSRNY